ncbi:ABC transporter permease [Rhodoligotrophos defluvii]|uniref:ABC transporter permease n=1 Tax=Rhodoligotrophos defluvii TaxID=2561934 RepID=UPI0010C9B5ED|nr:ABC transporter permease [Rhodoligotrophos defluvii]
MNHDRIIGLFLRLYVVIIFGLIFAPIVVSFIFSFSADRFPSLPLSAFSLQWYEAVWNDPQVLAAARRTVIVGIIVSVLATAIGFGAAYTDYRYSFRFKPLYVALGFMPPLVPILILGLAMLFYLAQLGLSGHLYSIVIGHTVLCIPFAMAVIRLRLAQMDPALEAAAWNLGASEWRAMMSVVVPFTLPAIFAALFVTAALSFDEFAIVWFISGLEETLPVRVLNFVQGQASPRINAIGSFTFTVSIVLVVLAQILVLTRTGRPRGRIMGGGK